MQRGDREQERVDRHIIERRDRVLELLAERAVWIGEHRERATAISLHSLDRQTERQVCEVDGVDLVQSRGRDVALVGGAHHGAGQEVVAVGAGVHDRIACKHFVQTCNLRGLHIHDLHLRIACGQRLLDLSRRIRFRRGGDARPRKDERAKGNQQDGQQPRSHIGAPA